MPRLGPFTTLCRQTSVRPALDRADLHVHTTCSDGTYIPAQVIELALRAGLCAVAVTDHDTLEGVEPARRAARGTGLEVIPAVEITTEHDGRELHLLAYFVSLESGRLTDALRTLRERRRGRFLAMIERLKDQGIIVDEGRIPYGDSLGRRHLAELLVQSGQVPSVREAFRLYLHDGRLADVPKQCLPLEEALACVRAAGGVSAWAHPPENCPRQQLERLRDLGLDAVEADYPSFRASRIKAIKELAGELGLATTGGSDCHGPDVPGRSVGACTVSREELEALRRRRRN